MNIIIIGKPGSGKGAQAEKISKQLNLRWISTGEMFRQEIRDNTELGMKAKKFMDKGELVPDEIVLGMAEPKLKENGFILDGFPRTVAQAETLDTITKIDKVLDLDVPDKVIIKRLSGRRYCNKCRLVFHVEYIKPKQEGICDNCGAELVQREDDKPESVKIRLQEYEKKTNPLIKFYEKKGTLYKIDGDQTIEKVFKEIEKVLSSLE